MRAVAFSRRCLETLVQERYTLLSEREVAGIAAILPNPRKFIVSNSRNYIERRKGRIVRHINYVGKLDY
jgi:hypothetical protein